MNKTLTIKIHQDPTTHVEEFFTGWQKIGTIEHVSDLEYKLIDSSGKTSLMSLGQFEITISGKIPSESFMLIDRLSRACEADKIIEGDIIDKNQTRHSQKPNFEDLFGNQNNAKGFKIPMGMNAMFKISSISKAKLIFLLVLALPLIIITLPVIFVIAIYKIIRFKLMLK